MRFMAGALLSGVAFAQDKPDKRRDLLLVAIIFTLRSIPLYMGGQ